MKKLFAAKLFSKGTCTQNYSRLYVGSQQGLRPFYIQISYGNAFYAYSLQALQVKTIFFMFLRLHKLKFICKFQSFPCSIHGEIPKFRYLNYVRKRIAEN